jgi:hypothetical protein
MGYHEIATEYVQYVKSLPDRLIRGGGVKGNSSQALFS